MQTVGGMAHTLCSGIERVRARLTLLMVASNRARLPKPLTA